MTHGCSLLHPLVAEGGLPSEGPGTNLLLSLQNPPMVLFVLSKFIMNQLLIFQRRRPDCNQREVGALQGAAGVRGQGSAAEWTVEEETGRPLVRGGFQIISCDLTHSSGPLTPDPGLGQGGGPDSDLLSEPVELLHQDVSVTPKPGPAAGFFLLEAVFPAAVPTWWFRLRVSDNSPGRGASQIRLRGLRCSSTPGTSRWRRLREVTQIKGAVQSDKSNPRSNKPTLLYPQRLERRC